MNLSNRVLISRKTSRPTPFRAELRPRSAASHQISDAAKQLRLPRRVSGEYSRGKVPNVLANSTAVIEYNR